MAEDAFGIVGSVIASAYHVESAVAEGGFGTVYRAHHGGFRAPVALKCLRLPPGLSAETQQHFLDSFRSEAEILFRLSASIPTVVRPLHVDAFTTADGRFVPYMVLEWLEGDTLDALIRRRNADGQAPFALKKLIRMLTPVARALERAHNFHGPDGPVSIVHRDLKPENIFVANVAGEETVKILDFGIGKAKSLAGQVAGRASQDASGIASFTPAYGSPEQWSPKQLGQTGPWTDVWGLALTLTEALTGKPVIDGDPASSMGTILDPRRRPTPGSEGVIVSDEVEAVFTRALALDPRDRQADAGIFWNELLAAARVTSGEMTEVRLPRDARAEHGGGVRVEHVDVTRRPSGRPPSLAPRAQGPRDPPGPPVNEDSVFAAAARAPDSTSPPTNPSAVSGSFHVPDLDLAEVRTSRPPERLPGLGGVRPAVGPPLDFEEAAALDAQEIALDLPSHDPLVRRKSFGGMPAVLPDEQPSLPPPARLSSPAPIAAASLHPRSLAPPVVADSSLPPASHSAVSAAWQANSPAGGGSLPPPPAPLRLSLAAAEHASLKVRLLPGAVLVAGAILVTILDQSYSAFSGEVFMVGPLRTSVLAGIVMLAGIGLALFRLKRS